jgi:hypothetical protein
MRLLTTGRAGARHTTSRSSRRTGSSGRTSTPSTPSRRQMDPLRYTLGQRDAQVPLLRLDLLGQRRSRHAQPLGGPGETPLLGHREEVPQLPQLHERE